MVENPGKSHLPQLMALFESLPPSQKNAALRQMQEGIFPAQRNQPEDDVHICEFCEDFVMSSSSEKIHDVLMNPFANYQIDVRDPSKILYVLQRLDLVMGPEIPQCVFHSTPPRCIDQGWKLTLYENTALIKNPSLPSIQKRNTTTA